MNHIYFLTPRQKEGVYMERKSPDRIVQNERGNILIICVVILMILTSLGIYALNSTTVEITMAGRDKQEAINFQNAEAGMRFAMTHFMAIYNNNNGAGVPIYTTLVGLAANNNGPGVGGIVSYSTATGSVVLTASNRPTGNTIPLRDMNPGTGAVAFQYSDPDGTPIALIEIKDILSNTTGNPSAFDVTINMSEALLANTIAARVQLFTPFANNVPNYSHIGSPPEGYGDAYVSRNYMITSTPLTRTGGVVNIVGRPVQCGIKVPILKKNAEYLMRF